MTPRSSPRLDEIEANTHTRLAEARQHHWLGEVEALQESLRHLTAKRAQLPAAAI